MVLQTRELRKAKTAGAEAVGRILAPPSEREPSLARSTHVRSRMVRLFSPRVLELPLTS
jgi:hypothetical protein